MNQHDWLDTYLLSFPGAIAEFKPEWKWMRYLIGGKQFAAICTPGKEHHEHAGREMVILKCDPLFSEQLRKEHKDIVPGFYSNKQHWNSLYLDGELSDDLIKLLCETSYKLVYDSLTKKQKTDISEIST